MAKESSKVIEPPSMPEGAGAKMANQWLESVYAHHPPPDPFRAGSLRMQRPKGGGGGRNPIEKGSE